MDNKSQSRLKAGVFLFSHSKKDMFINDCNKILKSSGYVGELSLNINGCIITKNNNPNWVKNTIYDIKNKCENNTQYRLVFDHLENDLYYFEKNGAINCIDNILKKYECHFTIIDKHFISTNFKNIDKLDDMKKMILKYYKDNLHKYIFEYDGINIVKQLNLDTKGIDFSSINFFNGIGDIQEIESCYRLPNYNKKKCINSKGNNDEGEYNRLVCESNDDYILLDKKYAMKSIEVADIYDTKNKIMYHNKKRGDLRGLAFQIINGTVILKDNNERNKFIQYLKDKGTNADMPNDFRYVCGIIGNKKDIAKKDQFALIVTNNILKNFNVKFYINYIQVDN